MKFLFTKRSIQAMVLVVVILSFMNIVTFAGGGNGGGTGGGNGGGVSPLTLESSIPLDGDSNVSTDGKIELVFSNNVVNMSVSENNKVCFKLMDASNNEVPIDVIMGDDQVDPTIKNNITIQALSKLNENTEYKLVIGPELMSKNGMTIGKETVLTFTTLKSSSNTLTYILGIMVIIGGISLFVLKKGKR